MRSGEVLKDTEKSEEGEAREGGIDDGKATPDQ
jgi:hypothetical protein